jgi:hypothetical protein
MRQRWQPPSSERMHLLFRALQAAHLRVFLYQH